MAKKSTKVGRGTGKGTSKAPGPTPGPWSVAVLPTSCGGFIVQGKGGVVIGAFGRNTSMSGQRISQEEAMENAYALLHGLYYVTSRQPLQQELENNNVRAGKKRTRR